MESLAQVFRSGTTGVAGPQNFAELIGIFLDLIKLLIPVVASLALLAFFWGLVKFINNVSGDTKAITEGKNLMIWGLIALFVMVSVWGILRFVYGELGLSPTFGLPFLPQ
jgi:hypothetical protein